VGRDSLRRYVDFYLSPRHRDDVASGCPIPGLMSEAPPAPAEVRAAYKAGVRRLVVIAADLHPGLDRKAALALLADMAGAVAFARALDDKVASSPLLAATRVRIQNQLALVL
jgi:TetR/AcrR family transcriptional repressor of nem operon